jgi:Protein of unknown function (DUF1275)
MPPLTSGGHGAQRVSALAASAIAAAAGGVMDAWVFMAHGVFATAQSGNAVLMGIALARGDLGRAATHLPPLVASSRDCWFQGGRESSSSAEAQTRAISGSASNALCLSRSALWRPASRAER